MPDPRPGESQTDFIGRCVPYCAKEGLTQKQALGKCYGLWRQHHKAVGAARRTMKKHGMKEGD